MYFLNRNKDLFFILLLCTSFVGLSVYSSTVKHDNPVLVQGVRFDSLDNDWLQAEIKLRARANTTPGSRTLNYVDSVRLKITLSYKVPSAPGGYDFYQATVEMPSLKRGELYRVYFYLPGVIVQRDRLSREPHAYIVELDVGGRKLPLRKENLKPSFFKEASFVTRYLNRARLQAPMNEGILLPQYHAPPDLTENLGNSPAFARKHRSLNP